MYHKGVDINKIYKVGVLLGQGTFGIVKNATNKKTGEMKAVKIIYK